MSVKENDIIKEDLMASYVEARDNNKEAEADAHLRLYAEYYGSDKAVQLYEGYQKYRGNRPQEDDHYPVDTLPSMYDAQYE